MLVEGNSYRSFIQNHLQDRTQLFDHGPIFKGPSGQ